MDFDELVQNLIENWESDIYRLHHLGHCDADIASHINAREYFSTDRGPLPICKAYHIRAALKLIVERQPHLYEMSQEHDRIRENEYYASKKAEALRAETARANSLEKQAKKKLSDTRRRSLVLNRPKPLPYDENYYGVWFEYSPGPDPRIYFVEAVSVADL